MRFRATWAKDSKWSDLLIILVMGSATPLMLSLAGTLSTKWVIFITLLLCFSAALLVIPAERRFSVLLFGFFFFIPIRVDFNPVYIVSNFFRPFNGFAINLYELLFAGVFLIWMFRLVRHPEEKIHFIPVISVPFALIFFLTAVGLMNSNCPSAIKAAGLKLVLESWLIFLFLANTIRDDKMFRLITLALISTIAIQAVIGFLQNFAGGLLGLESFGEGRRGFFMAKAGVETISRVGGTLGHPNGLSVYLDFLLPVTVALLFSGLDHRLKRYFVLPILLLGVILDLMTLSRGGWVGLGGGGSIAVYACLARLTRRKATSLALVLGLLIVMAVTSVVFVGSVRKRLTQDDYGTAYTRVPMSKVALNIIRHNPLFGVGLTNYTSVAEGYDETVEAISFNFPMPVHNEYLLMASEQGLPAMFLFVFIQLAVVVQLIRLARTRESPLKPFLAIGFLGGMVAWTFHLQFEFTHAIISPSFWSYMGLIQAMILWPEPGKK
ncbi:MAG: O-antigen ligase family protein [Pseudomonadota bacterium]